MSRPLIVFLFVRVCAVLGAVHHELNGEHPDQVDIDNGQCIPIPCVMGVPPKECTRQCALRHYLPVCKPPANFCLCQHLVNGKIVLVSPDEMEEEPPEPTKLPTDDDTDSYTFFAIFLPIKQFFYESSEENEVTTSQPSTDSFVNIDYESVNVHEGRLFWDFRFILTGLLLLMIGLVIYELAMCAIQVYRPKHRELSVKCEPETVKPPFFEDKKILSV